MIVKRKNDIPDTPVKMEGAEDVTIRVLVGQDDGSEKIAMRCFCVRPGGHTPEHTHNFEHLVRVQKGRGQVVDPYGRAVEVAEGDSLFVPADEKHQFRNPFKENFEFICVIPV